MYLMYLLLLLDSSRLFTVKVARRASQEKIRVAAAAPSTVIVSLDIVIAINADKDLISDIQVQDTMSDHAWALKNGDMDQVKELVDGKVDSRAEQNREVEAFCARLRFTEDNDKSPD